MQTDLSITLLGEKFIDLRGKLPGDSFNWNWNRPLDQVNYLAIHHSNTDDTATPEDIASFHITNNKWGGIGYHFLIDKEGVVFYVGDISTARANVANLNEQVIGIGLIGNFTAPVVPTPLQLQSTHKLCEFFINSGLLPNVSSWDKVRGHKELPNQSTNCPGDDWTSWRIQIVEGLNIEPTEEIEPVNDQVESLQASLASLNQQVIFLQEALQEKDIQINNLKTNSDTTLTIVGVLINLYKFVFRPGKVNP